MAQRPPLRRAGLYDPDLEHDACGVGFVAHIKNQSSHDIISQGLTVLRNLTHRGAVGADPKAGDGAGILIQVPHHFYARECQSLGIQLPSPGHYAVAMVFLPTEAGARETCEALLTRLVEEEGQSILGWRELPVDNTCLGDSVRASEPVIRQLFIARSPECPDADSFERKLLVIRKRAYHATEQTGFAGKEDFYIVSLSSRTVVYKGMILAKDLEHYFPDLKDPAITSALALVHQRFSTNTMPRWSLAQPFRYLCHNGEINTLRGNVNWMTARRHNMRSEVMGADLGKIWPLISYSKSDSACLDNALELLVAGGYSLVHAMMLLIPEAWAGNPLMDAQRRAFYEYHASLMEPWDGPAAVAFTDGRQIGATLDRNGLRPARYVITDDDRVILASEAGVLDIPEERIVKKWRLQPGKMFLIDLEEGRIIDDSEIKAQLATAKPYQQWLDQTQTWLDTLPREIGRMAPDRQTLLDRQQAFGYTEEDIKFFLEPMTLTGQDPIGAMGQDIPLAVLSHRPKLLSDYFKQNFAQVTNPPIDPIREELVMSLTSFIGPRPNLLDLNAGGNLRRLAVKQPILSNTDLERIRAIEHHLDRAFRTRTLSMCYPASNGAGGMQLALDRLCEQATDAVREGYNILVLSDRDVAADQIAIPALLATAAVHHHLIRQGLRTASGLVVETGEARRVHDFCLLAGYGAEAINPYLVFDVVTALLPGLSEPVAEADAHQRYIKAVDKGILKVMSKMGISTYQSYCGAQIFDAVGLSTDFIERYFTGTHSTIEGVGLAEIAAETAQRHGRAFGGASELKDALDPGGEIAYRMQGETHIWNAQTVSLLQHAVRKGDFEQFKAYTAAINDQSAQLKNLRGLFEFRFDRPPVPLDEVEPAEEIVKRFATGAMSFGSLSWEAHTNMAIAMNRLGAKSNSGEGGEDAIRYQPTPEGDSMSSAIKQVASARFGVTADYLVHAKDIQIKMAQGAKPGEGGQLPGHKVDEAIARVRHSTPGVGLISPPPHHDIYSIEDLAQLIYDLKNVNPEARISVKLVSEVGVGTVAAGVAKAHANHLTISGHEGGTGASPLTSIHFAGSPWEIGLAETQQTLVLNRLRGRLAVQVDGGIRTGRDIVVGALLGADEFGIGTAALIAQGCIMMRKCHLNTCPVGIATQDGELRRRFPGTPDDLVRFFMFLAQEVRSIMAELGYRRFSDMVGHSERLNMRPALDHWKARGLDFSRILHPPKLTPGDPIAHCQTQHHDLGEVLDRQLIAAAKKAFDCEGPVTLSVTARNTDRSIGAMLSGEVARRYGGTGLSDDKVHVNLTGCAGQSFGAFVGPGITLDLTGEANDYVGKGLCGGRLIIRPPATHRRAAESNIIVGNTVLYGATSGEAYIRGIAGERFAVRNSGAIAVVEGVGDHGCEYMTGGLVVVLGETGRNFAAGMSGGIAYVLDLAGDFRQRCNLAMVDLEPIADEAAHGTVLEHHGGELTTHGWVDVSPHMTQRDAEQLHALIHRHHQLTGSDRAADILEHWTQFMPRFVKIIPIEYRHALERLQAHARPTRRSGVSLTMGG